MDSFQQSSNPISGAVFYKEPKQTDATDTTLQKEPFAKTLEKYPQRISSKAAELANIQRELSSFNRLLSDYMTRCNENSCTSSSLEACEYCIMLLECGISIRRIFISASEHVQYYCLIPDSLLL